MTDGQSLDEVRYDEHGAVAVVTIDRQHRRNAIDGRTAQALYDAWQRFEADDKARVLVLTGAGEAFCAGADLTDIASLAPRANGPDGPLGFTRRTANKPTIAAIDGWAVAGGLELALWCDLRVMAEDAVFGVFCRRWGVPLVDGGTVRLPRLIGHGAALDLVLTGRPVGAEESLRMGLATRIVPSGTARGAAVALAHEIAALPQVCLRSDRASLYEQWDLPLARALTVEMTHGMEVLRSGDAGAGADRFVRGAGRHGAAGP